MLNVSEDLTQFEIIDYEFLYVYIMLMESILTFLK